MKIRLFDAILTLLLWLSLLRATEIWVFLPADEMRLGEINYLPQTILNYLLLLLLCAYIFLQNNYRFLLSSMNRAAVAFFLLFLAMNMALSINPVESVKFLITVVVISVPAALYGYVYGPQKLVTSLANFVLVMSLANLAYTLTMPQYAIMTGHHDGRWKGLFEHKNAAGPFFAIGFFVLLYDFKPNRLFKTGLQIIALITCLLFLVMSKSATALVCFGSMLAFYVLIRYALLFMPKERIAILIGGVSLIVLMMTFLGGLVGNVFFELTGKDATLTGRTGIWEVVLEHAVKRPLQGYGIGMAERPEFMENLRAEIGWPASSAHNSYLDVIVGLGFPMAGCFIFFLLKIWFSSYISIIPPKRIPQQTLALALVLTGLVVAGGSSGALLARSIFWMYMVVGLSTLYVAHATSAAQQRLLVAKAKAPAKGTE